MCAAHPYEGYIKTLKFGDKEGKYFDLLRLGGEKYGRLVVERHVHVNVHVHVHVYL